MIEIGRLERAARTAAARGRLIVTGHDAPDVDSLVSCALLTELFAFWGIKSEIVTPTRPDPQAERVMRGFGYAPEAWRGPAKETDSVALVDHHAWTHPGRLAICVDHHPTENPPSCDALWIGDAGACALMTLRLLEAAGMGLTDRQRTMAVTALYLDTMALRSAKVSAVEAAWGREQAKALGLDEAWLEREGLALDDMRLPARELAARSRKQYEFGGKTVISTYVQLGAPPGALLDALLAEIRQALAASGADLWVFIVHEPLAGRSAEYDLCADGSLRIIRYDHLASRGKEIMPRVEREMLEEKKHG